MKENERISEIENEIRYLKEYEFLKESNAIESEYSTEALDDAIEAWCYLKEQEKITPETVLDVHRILMKNLRPEIAGRYRSCDVWIGKKCKRFISFALLKEDLTKICKSIMNSIHEDQNKDIHTKDSSAKQLHIEFEEWHGFEDGNGRSGRMIWNWHRLKLGLPLTIIHADFPKKDGEQIRYYKMFSIAGY